MKSSSERSLERRLPYAEVPALVDIARGKHAPSIGSRDDPAGGQGSLVYLTV
jgi:hypothetical protein